MANMRGVIRRPLRLGKGLAKKAIGLVPPPKGRLTGTLAIDGGKPVRDLRFRPWPKYPRESAWDWFRHVGPTLRSIFCGGQEGLPGTLGAEFCRRWADYCGVRHALLLPHGTDALRAALAAALDHDGLDYGGEVIVPNLTFIASGNAALDRRLGIALVDVDPETLNVDPRCVEEAIIPGRTRAIMAVHLSGQAADMTALRDIAARHKLALIEDAAQAHGAIHELGRAGALGDVAAFSFQSAKNLCSGEGGVLTTNDPDIYQRAYGFHNVGRLEGKSNQRWHHTDLGWNCRATEYVAAVLLHRLRTLETEQELRATRFGQLRQMLGDVACIKPYGIGPGVKRHGVHMFMLRYRPEACGNLDIDDFVRAIEAEGISVGRGYQMTLAQQPVYQRLMQKRPEYFRLLPTPVADQAVREMILIPHRLFLGSEADMVEIAAAFRKVQAKYAPASTLSAPPNPGLDASVRATAPKVPVLNGAATRPRVTRIGVIGVGAQGRLHARVISQNRMAKLAGVADVSAQAAADVAREFDSRAFASAEELVHSGAVDAIVIATPHWQHADLAVDGLRAGLHVLCEKPLTVTVAQADEVLQAARESDVVFAAVHQTRFDAAFQHAKDLLDRGELGPLLRCSMVESAWRTDAYYRSNSWRGTWKGEGGGVLLNQAPHVLDRYAWLCGMPETVLALCDTNTHKIEVEDTASAIFRHATGAHGYLHVNTVECPSTSRTTITCDRGQLIIEPGKVLVTRLAESLREKTANERQVWADMKAETRVLHFPEASLEGLLSQFYDDVLRSVDDRSRPLVSPGDEGRYAVELANAILLSSHQNRPVSLPIDRDEYTHWLEGMVGPQLSAVSS